MQWSRWLNMWDVYFKLDTSQWVWLLSLLGLRSRMHYLRFWLLEMVLVIWLWGKGPDLRHDLILKLGLKMIFSNAIGSNVFDIDLGLGLPFLIFTLVRDKPVSLLSISEWVSIYLKGICRSIVRGNLTLTQKCLQPITNWIIQ